jgi:hypothetical protein
MPTVIALIRRWFDYRLYAQAPAQLLLIIVLKTNQVFFKILTDRLD